MPKVGWSISYLAPTHAPHKKFQFYLRRLSNLVLLFSLLFTFCLQDDREVRVYEDEETGENEKIVEISTGPKGIHSLIIIMQVFVWANEASF